MTNERQSQTDPFPLRRTAYGIRHLFQGQLWTQETGLNDYRNRVELPTMGVFLQPDPIGFKGDAANIYRFCNNNAVNRTDPLGLIDRNPADRMWDFACFGDSGNSYQGGWNEFINRNQPAGNQSSAGARKDEGVKLEMVQLPLKVVNQDEVRNANNERILGITEPDFKVTEVNSSIVRGVLSITQRYPDGPGTKAGTPALEHAKRREPEHLPVFERFMREAAAAVKALNQRGGINSPAEGIRLMEGQLRSKFNDARAESHEMDNPFNPANHNYKGDYER